MAPACSAAASGSWPRRRSPSSPTPAAARASSLATRLDDRPRTSSCATAHGKRPRPARPLAFRTSPRSSRALTPSWSTPASGVRDGPRKAAAPNQSSGLQDVATAFEGLDAFPGAWRPPACSTAAAASGAWSRRRRRSSWRLTAPAAPRSPPRSSSAQTGALTSTAGPDQAASSLLCRSAAAAPRGRRAPRDSWLLPWGPPLAQPRGAWRSSAAELRAAPAPTAPWRGSGEEQILELRMLHAEIEDVFSVIICSYALPWGAVPLAPILTIFASARVLSVAGRTARALPWACRSCLLGVAPAISYSVCSSRTATSASDPAPPCREFSHARGDFLMDVH